MASESASRWLSRLMALSRRSRVWLCATPLEPVSADACITRLVKSPPASWEPLCAVLPLSAPAAASTSAAAPTRDGAER